jgi:hypothetical protein
LREGGAARRAIGWENGMARQRDYKAEYQRRLARASARGLSRSQARGHARAGESAVRPNRTIKSDDRLEAALKTLRRVGKQTTAAKEAGISPERLRRFLRENALAERRGRMWQITDRRPRRMTVISKGEAKNLILSEHDQLSLNGRHLAAVQKFLRSNDTQLLLPFEGQAVADAKGRPHPLETDPNALHRIASAGGEVFHEVYRLVQ